ncbi:MAG: S4 domain-containing protein YaaA [Erysipelothrix sp.]|nr:S4 domain-containing protein YaaA [Erysipelothrix sp.]
MVITTEYITLGQLLKFAGLAYSGGDIKAILANSEIFVNGEAENRRGKKLYAGDIIKIDDNDEIIIKNDNEA